MKKLLGLIGAAAIICGFASAASATPIFYDVNLSIGATGDVVGFIETDGTIGSLSGPNFLDWSLKITNGVDPAYTLLGPLSGNNSTLFVTLSDQSATSTAILFNFSASDGGYFFFQSPNTDFVCFGPGDPTGICANGVASYVEGISLNTHEQDTPLTGTQVIATVRVPEPASIALLLAGLAGLGFSRRPEALSASRGGKSQSG